LSENGKRIFLIFIKFSFLIILFKPPAFHHPLEPRHLLTIPWFTAEIVDEDVFGEDYFD